MSYGLRLRRESTGSVSIDENYANYRLWASGTVSISAGWWPVPAVCLLTFPAPVAKPPLIAIRCSAGHVGLLSYTIDGTGAYTGANLTGDPFTGGSWPPFDADYKLFVPASGLPPSGDTHGLRVFGASGAVTFDSGFDYMRVLYAASISRVAATAGSGAALVRTAHTHPSLPGAYFLVAPFYGYFISYVDFIPELGVFDAHAPLYCARNASATSIEHGWSDAYDGNQRAGSGPEPPNDTPLPIVLVA